MNKYDAIEIAESIFTGYEKEAYEYMLDRDFWYSMTTTELKLYLNDNKDYIIKHQLSEY